MAAATGPQGGPEGALQQRIGPWPVYVYLLVLTVALGAWYLWDKHKNGGSSAAAADSGQAAAGETASAQDVPDYVFQTTIQNTQPPEAPTPAGPASPVTPTPTQNPGDPTRLPASATRHVSQGNQSLASIAKARNTTVAHLITTTEANLDAANLAAFKAYLKKSPKGTAKLPKGLVWYGSK
jgi:hypothetical protein